MKNNREKAKFFISTRIELLEERINTFISECEENFKAFNVVSMSPFMSYAGLGRDNKGGYMIGCMVRYTYKEPINEEVNDG